jgi:RNA polymerase sigma factor (sigma-70 family)
MQFRRSANDVILQPFLHARGVEESNRQLTILLTEHADPWLKGIIMARLHSYFSNYERHPDFEDLCSEVKTRLLIYLEELKAAPSARPCRDFRSYVATIAHNACNDYLRQIYPARTRLYKQVRDLLHAHPDFTIWRTEDENNRSDLICGFDGWRRGKIMVRATDWLQPFCEDPLAIHDALAPGTDIQLMELDDLVAAIFNHVGEPIYIDDLVSIIADIRGIKDLPAVSFDDDEDGPAQFLSDSRLRIDTVLEMREPLKLVWEGLCQLPSEEFKVYILYARNTDGEDLISLFLAAKVVSGSEIARSLGMTVEEFQDLWPHKLPLDNESIARELGIRIERVYKLRFQASKRLKTFLSAKEINI